MSKTEFNKSLIDACKHGDVDKVKLYLTDAKLEKHFNIHEPYNDYICSAFENGQLEVIKFLLTSDELKKPMQLSKDEKNTFFEVACQYGNLDVITFMLTEPYIKDDIDVNSSKNYGLESASNSGYYEVVKFLTKLTPITNREKIDSAYNNACSNGHVDIVDYLLNSPEITIHANTYPDDCGGWHMACWAQHFPVIQLLINQGHHDFEDYKPFEEWFDTFSKEEMHNLISNLTQDKIQAVYDKHADFLVEKFLLEAGLPLHAYEQRKDGKKIDDVEEIEIMI